MSTKDLSPDVINKLTDVITDIVNKAVDAAIGAKITNVKPGSAPAKKGEVRNAHLLPSGD